jgi:hypothetical protein
MGLRLESKPHGRHIIALLFLTLKFGEHFLQGRSLIGHGLILYGIQAFQKPLFAKGQTGGFADLVHKAVRDHVKPARIFHPDFMGRKGIVRV